MIPRFSGFGSAPTRGTLAPVRRNLPHSTKSHALMSEMGQGLAERHCAGLNFVAWPVKLGNVTSAPLVSGKLLSKDDLDESSCPVEWPRDWRMHLLRQPCGSAWHGARRPLRPQWSVDAGITTPSRSSSQAMADIFHSPSFRTN